MLISFYFDLLICKFDLLTAGFTDLQKNREPVNLVDK